MKFGAILAILVFIPVSVSAEESDIRGAGAATCANFAQSYASNPGVYESVYFTWTQGFLSGLNAAVLASGAHGKDLNSMSVDEQEHSIRAYCDVHPLEDYWQAAFALYWSLGPYSH